MHCVLLEPKVAHGSAWVNLVEGAKFRFETHHNASCLKAPRIDFGEQCYNFSGSDETVAAAEATVASCT